MQITVELTDELAWDLAQFAKRLTFDAARECAQDQAEAYRIIQAVEAVRKALAEAGYSPR
jgi:hypothetical protein